MLEDQNLAIMFNKINHFADASLQLNATVNTNHYITFISTDLDISSNGHVQFLCQARLDSFQREREKEQRAGTNHGVPVLDVSHVTQHTLRKNCF